MNTVNVPRPSQKIPFLILLGVLLIGIPLTVIVLQQTQIFRQFAWSTRQAATAACSAEQGGAIITVQFTNTEDSKSMNVVAKDIQSGKSVDLGTIKPKETKSGKIVTESKELAKGVVQFIMKWSDGSSGTDTRTAEYGAVSECVPAPPFCPANPEITEGLCKWEPIEGATGYEVEVSETASGNVVHKELAATTASQSAFPMVPGKGYACTVTPINACTKGPKVKSPEKVCSAPTPTPTAPVCPAPPLKQGVCKWDPVDGAFDYNISVKASPSGETVKSGTVKAPETKFTFDADPEQTYICIVTAANKCSESPPAESPPISCKVPTPTPTTPAPTDVTPSPSPTITPSPSPTNTPTPTPTNTPTPTPTPTATPTPTPIPTSTPMPTPTPVIIVRIPPNRLPPTNPPPQIIVQQPPVIVQQPPMGGGQPIPTATFSPQQPTPVPTIPPTGPLSAPTILVGASVILLAIGSLIFFAL